MFGNKKQISDETWKNLIKELNPDENGKISHEKFEKLLRGSLSQNKQAE